MLVLHAHWQPPARPDENGTVLFWTETSAAPAEQNNPSQDNPAAGAQSSGQEAPSGVAGANRAGGVNHARCCRRPYTHSAPHSPKAKRRCANWVGQAAGARAR